jgi:hypothetical protein
VTTAFVIGYDPGGKDAHGVAVLEVCEENARWNLVSLQVAAGRAPATRRPGWRRHSVTCPLLPPVSTR